MCLCESMCVCVSVFHESNVDTSINLQTVCTIVIFKNRAKSRSQISFNNLGTACVSIYHYIHSGTGEGRTTKEINLNLVKISGVCVWGGWKGVGEKETERESCKDHFSGSLQADRI